MIEDTFGQREVKLPASGLLLPPSASVHRVEPMTKSARIACFTWLESMERETERRRPLFAMDAAIVKSREASAGSKDAVRFTACPRNLLRMWAAT